MKHYDYIEAFNNSTSDKNHTHKYAVVYDYIINSHYLQKGDKLDMLEIGIRMGDSLYVWGNSPQINKVVGIDITPKKEYEEMLIENNISFTLPNNVELIQGVNGYEENVSEKLKNEGKSFDLILDDGDHMFESQLKFFNNYYDLLNPGGVLMCEDITQTYLPQLRQLAQQYTNFYVFDIRLKSNVHGNEIIAILKK
jgi:predicted O-methyltransferase YrrM